jgi:hypothetical protein
MLVIKVRETELVEAKRLRTVFDENKSYDKIKCANNYIGVLGEIVFDRYLSEQGIEHTWIPFVKDSCEEPDFVIGGVTIDLKTTYSDSMWFQQPIHDLYVYAHMSKDDGFLIITSFITKDGLVNSKFKEKVIRNNRIDYVIRPQYMLPIEVLRGIRK